VQKEKTGTGQVKAEGPSLEKMGWGKMIVVLGCHGGWEVAKQKEEGGEGG